MDAAALPTVTYTPRSQLRQPGSLLASMARDLVASRGLAWRLFVRNFRARYRQSVLGYIWAFLPAAAQTLVWMFLNGQGIINFGETDVPYPVYVLTGILLWGGFVESIRSPMDAVTLGSTMLTRINFPREALLLAGMADTLVNFGIRLLILIPVYAYFRMPLDATMLLAPLGMLGLFAFGMTLGMLLLPLAMLFGDVNRIVNMAFGLWFFVTPVVYPPPTEFPGAWIMVLNPASPLLAVTRDWMTANPTPYLLPWAVLTVASLLMLVACWIMYRLAMPFLIERMG